MKLTSILSNLSIRSCMNCGSWMNLRTFFCSECHQKCLQEFAAPETIDLKYLKLRSLFRWPSGKSDVLSALVLQMKTEPADSWKIWATEFVSQIELPRTNTLLVTAESASGHLHSQNWARALSEIINWPHVCALRLQDAKVPQRQLKKEDRASRKMTSCEDFSKWPKTRIIFVDDVVTTGQTALAAYKALNEPSDFEVWSLIYREL